MSDFKLIEPKFRKTPRERKKEKYDRLGYGLAGASALGFGAAMSKVIKNKLDQDYGKVDKKNSGGVMLKGKQKKLDKNRDGKITSADFALMKKSGYKMGGFLGSSSNRQRRYKDDSDRMTTKDIQTAKDAVGNQDRMTKKDVEKASSAVGKRKGGMTKAKSGKYLDKYERGLDFHPDPLVRSGKMSRETYDTVNTGMNMGLGAMGIYGAGTVGYIGNEIRKSEKERKRKRKEYKQSKGSMTQGSFKKGGVMKAKTGDLADTMKKLRKKVYEKSMKKNKKVGRFGDDEYLIQKPLPGMKKGKAVMKAKDGDFIERRKKLGSYKAIVDINPMQSDLEKAGPGAFLMRRAMLSGASTLGSTAKETTKSIAKKTAKDAVKVGLGAGAGYEYAKSKKDKSKKDK